MILKFLTMGIILFLIYILFFKKSRNIKTQNTKKEDAKIEDIMVECPTCGTYVSKKEAVISNGNFYCSKECLTNK